MFRISDDLLEFFTRATCRCHPPLTNAGGRARGRPRGHREGLAGGAQDSRIRGRFSRPFAQRTLYQGLPGHGVVDGHPESPRFGATFRHPLRRPTQV